MSYALTLKLSFFETVVLCKALGLYINDDDESPEDREKATAMLRDVERALERGPSLERDPAEALSRRMATAIDQRRLRDGATALEVSDLPAETITEIRSQLEVVGAGIAALQSFDDLGPVANDQAARDEQELWKRRKVLEQRLKELEGKKVTP